MRRYKDIHAGKTCIIIGNGPSLKNVPMDFLKQYPTFGSNRIYRIFQPTYYCCTDVLDLAKNREQINAMKTPKFVRAGQNVQGWQIEVVERHKDPAWLTFSYDPTQPIYDGATVTYVALQLAYYMGFATVLLVGVDHRYTWKGSRLRNQVADGHDKNHWAEDYHDPGEVWQPPNLDRTTVSYGLAYHAYLKAGRKIINLTPGTALDVFPKDDLKNWYKPVESREYASRFQSES